MVDFPDPLAPANAIVRPSLSVKLTSCTAGVCWVS